MIDTLDRQLIAALQNGLPIVSRPYFAIAQTLHITEHEVIERLTSLKQQGLIKRLGVIVHHRKVGYRANAMIVWNIPDNSVDRIGKQLSQASFVNLCYLRPRHENWSYNLYCMIHGKSRDIVLAQLQILIEQYHLAEFDYQVLFSLRCFKQRGAIYAAETCKNTLCPRFI
jgi:siroheme decarboxylase